MSVLFETTVGDIVIDLLYKEAQSESFNFLKLCKANFYQYQLFYNLKRHFSVQTGDALLGNENRHELRFHNAAFQSLLKENGSSAKLITHFDELQEESQKFGDVCMILGHQDDEGPLYGSQILISLSETPRSYQNTIKIGHVIPESEKALKAINQATTDDQLRPAADIRIRKVHILHDPFPDPDGLIVYSPKITTTNLRLPLENEKDSADEINFIDSDIRSKELTLEVLGDIRQAGIKPSERVLFVCKLNPLTRAKDLAIIFQQCGEVIYIEIVRDKSSGSSLCYGFIEYADRNSCEIAYSKMEGVLIDDRRIHVDFCQSSKSMKVQSKSQRTQTSKPR
ncbi:LAMI_0F02586g1_1 [Lachancea mirantina]|uniref:Peptidyl-prolyl cis-trans isomerase n=1 Tax=Lachancea mirantina TaxID=1230905 RepID=A0A1G4JWK8_9SACH|nr:LAMI_0F02586g1_1 [Lachancea mirantina]